MPVEFKVTVKGPALPEAICDVCMPTGAVQVVPANRLNVMLPVGANPPVMAAESPAELPTIMEVCESDVVTVGVAFATVSVSVPQRLWLGWLLLSPL